MAAMRVGWRMPERFGGWLQSQACAEHGRTGPIHSAHSRGSAGCEQDLDVRGVDGATRTHAAVAFEVDVCTTYHADVSAQSVVFTNRAKVSKESSSSTAAAG